MTGGELDTVRPAETGPNGYPEDWETPLSVALERLAVERERLAVEREHLAVIKSIRDMVRGRDGDGNPLKSVLSALVMVVTAVAKAPPAHPVPSAPVSSPSSPPANGKRVAAASEIDGQYGNPKVRFDVKKKWIESGKPSQKGKAFSDCDPAFLDLYADALDYYASKAQELVDAGTADDNKKKEAKFGPVDAARARGWAARIRATGYKSPPAAAPPPDDYD